MEEEKIIKVFTVRGRPVGLQGGKWGGALVAVERGDFPISPTGFRSLSGAGEAVVTPGFLENLAKAHERNRQEVLHRLREAQKPVGDTIYNYIHVSGAYEQGIQYGFYASDRDRAALWAGASRLLCMVDSDARFQPVPDPTYVAWTKEHCDLALARARELKALLARLAAGEFPMEMPIRMIGVTSYLELPPKAGGEPMIPLEGYTAELALNLPRPAESARRQTRNAAAKETAEGPIDSQLGLFDSPSVGTTPAAKSPAPGMKPF